VTANAMSSAPANNLTDDPTDDLPPDYDEYEDAARHTEKFLASFMHNSDDCYDDEPVHITANMMSNDEMRLLSSEPDNSSPALSRGNQSSENETALAAAATPNLDPLFYVKVFQVDLTTINGINM
jgi:hypothetical protein